MDIKKLFDLSEKTVIITGSAGFLCSEMALAFHAVGCSVILLDANLEGADLSGTIGLPKDFKI